MLYNKKRFLENLSSVGFNSKPKMCAYYFLGFA